jgi:PIN domain nuclease of toxin-antitoxin system
MRLMLDTHAFLWADLTPDKLTQRVRDAFVEPANTLHLSLASIWEIQIKVKIGKLKLRMPLMELIRDHQTRNGLILEAIDLPDILHLDTLPFHHRDPFDRMIISQTLQRGFHLVSDDPEFPAYGVPLFW